MPRFHFGVAADCQETTKTKLPPIPDVVLQQPLATNSLNFLNNSKTETYQNTQTPRVTQGNDVESRMSPAMGTLPPESGSDTEPFLGKQTRGTPVQCLNNS